uniref:Alpha-globin transcription factor CP2 n=1 Tax=Cacopsylla melanoneura TaxID=428564 RepID=A0A8D8UVL4_9HEMI
MEVPLFGYVMPSSDLIDSKWDTWSSGVMSEETNGKRKMGERQDDSPGSSSWTEERGAKFLRLEAADQTVENGKSGSHVSAWHHVEDLASNLTSDFDGNFSGLGVDLNSGSYNLNDALLSLPSLTVFKEETPSPNHSQNQNENSNSRSAVDVSYHQQSPYHGSDSGSAHLEELTNLCPRSNSNEVTSTGSPPHNSVGIEDVRFQYVLGAATSIATKISEESLTYLNQGQSYEIKFKRLHQEGVRHFPAVRGRILRSVIRVSFHDRRLQYTEREQMSLWRATRPGDRILEVDLPLSYGICELVQDNASFNSIQFHWDPSKDVGVYIKVNCISTEFTAKKHGGEKGVPFRIQVDTFVEDAPPRHLHSASCQIKVFKLKGADRKHKQDKEKIMKRPPGERDKYQESYEYTVLTEVQYGADNPPPCTPALSVSPHLVDSSDSGHEPNNFQLVPSLSKDEPHNKAQEGDSAEFQDGQVPLTRDFTVTQVQNWLQARDFAAYMVTFANYTGVDMLRLSREDLKALCGLSEGIRLFNSIHPELLAHKRTIYLLVDSDSMVYHPIFLYRLTAAEMCSKLMRLLGVSPAQVTDFYLQGPNDIHVIITDELVHHLQDEAQYSVDLLRDVSDSERYRLLLKPVSATSSASSSSPTNVSG